MMNSSATAAINNTNIPAAHHAVINSVEMLRSDSYLRSIAALPADKQLLKRKIYEMLKHMIALFRQGQPQQIGKLAHQLLQIAPDNPEIYMLLGHMYLDMFSNEAAAADLLDTYVKINDSNPWGWALLCIAGYRLERLQQAEHAGRKALQYDPGNVPVYITMAQIAQARRDFSAAYEYSRKGLAVDPANHTLLSNMGWLLQVQGKKTEAENFYRDALTKYPQFYGGYYGLSEVSRITDEKDEILQQALSHAANVPENSEGAGILYFALARIYLQLKKKDEAWRWLTKAHAVLKSLKPYDMTIVENKCRTAVEFFSAEYFARPQLARVTSRQRQQQQANPVFIVGMPRSGTTLIEQIIASHSQVVARGELKELDILTRQIKQKFATSQEYPQALAELGSDELTEISEEYYRALLRGVTGNVKWAVDKNPFNFFRLGLIYQLFPGAKIIHCVRHPAAVAFSIYSNKFGAQMGWAHDLDDIACYYRHYRRLMQHWQQVLPLPIHTVSYEDMVADPRRQTEELLNFLELDWEESCADFHSNKREVATASLWQVRQPVYSGSVEKWREYEKELQIFTHI